MAKTSTIIYESTFQAIQFLPDDKLQLEALKCLLNFGFYDIEPKSDNPFVNMICVQAMPVMQNAKDRYATAIENGKKGGRPKDAQFDKINELKQSGLTNKEVAEQLGCSTRTVERANQQNRNAQPDKTDITPDKTRQNLTYTDTVTVPYTDTVTVPVAEAVADTTATALATADTVDDAVYVDDTVTVPDTVDVAVNDSVAATAQFTTATAQDDAILEASSVQVQVDEPFGIDIYKAEGLEGMWEENPEVVWDSADDMPESLRMLQNLDEK